MGSALLPSHRLVPQTPQRIDVTMLINPETFNTIWLVYIVLAQTFGWYVHCPCVWRTSFWRYLSRAFLKVDRYKNCNCVTSNWARAGGYLDFSVQDTSNSKWVLYYWTAGTTLTAFVMLLSMFYITVEWCQQSFLSTEDYADAMHGLRMTRHYRQYTYPVRIVARFAARYTLDPLEWLAYKVGLIKTTQQTLVWTKVHTWSPRVPQRLHPPSFELTEPYGGPATDSRVQDTPALAHSLFPPAESIGRSRTSSDTSLRPDLCDGYHYRVSNDSNTPLVRRPSETHHTGHRSNSPSSEEHRITAESRKARMSSDESTPFSGWLGLSPTLQSRHTYKRANSDPGSPPFEMPHLMQDAAEEHIDLERGPDR